MSVVTPEGRERNVLISWPDHFSGLATFFEGNPHRSSAVALVDCLVVVIHRDSFIPVLRGITGDLGAYCP